jgi:hypothetical protein
LVHAGSGSGGGGGADGGGGGGCGGAAAAAAAADSGDNNIIILYNILPYFLEHEKKMAQESAKYAHAVPQQPAVTHHAIKIVPNISCQASSRGAIISECYVTVFICLCLIILKNTM